MQHREETTHVIQLLKEIEMKLSDVLKSNVSIKNQLNKVEVEIIEKVNVLQAALDNAVANLSDVTLTDEQSQSVLDLQTATDALDNIVPDPAPVEPA
jgi:hypothetical protein